MKTYFLFYKDDKPYLRQKNPLAGTNLISGKMYAEHENLYNESALLLLNPIYGRNEYAEAELVVVWRYQGQEINGDPAFIGSEKEDYDQVFKLNGSVVDQLTRVRHWLVECFGEKVAADKGERAFRLLEECLELVQSLGLTREDVYRQVTYTYARPAGDVEQEVGGCGFTLIALCSALNINFTEAVEDAINSNWIRKEAIVEKWRSKTTVNPLSEY